MTARPFHTLSRLATAASVLAAVCFSTIALGQPLQNQVEILRAHANIGDSRVGIFVQDVETGEVLVELNASDPFIPASNQKLLTTGTSLAVLGPDFWFQTELRRSGSILTLVGSGDPALADPDLLAEMQIGVEDLLSTWIDAILQSGDEPITDIVVDARVFDREFVHPSWPKDQLNRWYSAEVSGLNFYTNVISFFLQKERTGAPPRIILEPATPWLKVVNRAKAVSRGQNTVWVARPATSNDMTVFGDLRQTLSSPIRVSIHDAPDYLGRLLATRMEYAGLDKPSVRVATETEEVPEGELIAVVRTPISTVVNRCNEESHNLYAEALLKRMGHEVTGRPGSFSNGAAVIRMAMQDILGPADTAPTIIADGSGLSRNNRVSPRAVGRWLRALSQQSDISDAFIDSLPVAGLEGTLLNRFQDDDLTSTVRAKSGYIRGVSCLSGYLIDADSDRKVAFSILVNDIPQHKVPIARVKRFHEAVVRVADGWLADQPNIFADAAPNADLGG